MKKNYISGYLSHTKIKTKPLLCFGALGFFLFLLLHAPVVLGQWTQKQDANFKHGEMGSVLYKGQIYLFMGFGEWPNVEPSNEAYNPVTDKWTLLAPIPAGKGVTHVGTVLVDDKVWIIGGRLSNNYGLLTSAVWIYDITQNRWSAGPELKDPATGQAILWGGGGAALVGRTIHVVGGFINTPCNNDQDKYHLTLNVDEWLADPVQTKWDNNLTPLPVKRNHISTTTFEGKIYVLGGQFGHDCGGGQDQKYSHMYDPLTDKWTRLTDMPTVRSHCEASIFPLDGKLYIAGGDGGPDKITIFSPAANGGLGSWANASFVLPTNPITNTNGYIGVAARVIGETYVLACGKLGNIDPHAQTFTRPFSRTIPYKLGFTASCFTKSLQTGQSLVLKNLLYTLEGEASYSLTSDAAWLKVTKNASGVALPTAVNVEATVNTAGLADGVYTANITAQSVGATPAYASASFCVKLTVGNVPEPTPEPVQVNAGGGNYTDGSSTLWESDRYFSGGVTSSKSFDVLGTTNDPLYLSYRYASGGKPFSYAIPNVEPGEYTVELHYVEPYFKSSGARKFHADLEGQRVLSNLDLYAASGYGRAVVKSFSNVAVTDGTLNVLFTSVTNNAIISGIKVFRTGTAPPTASYMLSVSTNGSGTVAKSPNQSTYASGTQVSLTASPANGFQFAGWSGDATGTTNPVSVTMNANKAVTATFTAAQPENGTYLNVGGTGYTDKAGQVWAADAYASSGVVSSKSFDVAGTSDDPLYLTYRYAASGQPFSYNIPVSSAGTYSVVLYFLEPYFGAPGSKAAGAVGARVFHVDVEGQRVLSNYDIYKEAGAGMAVIKTFANVSVTDGKLSLLFTSVTENAIISAIAINPSTAAVSSTSAIEMQALENNRHMLLYPNPNAGTALTIDFTGYSPDEKLRIELVDVTGRVLQTAVSAANAFGNAKVSFTPAFPLPRGVYYVQVNGAAASKQAKLVVR